MRGATFVPFGSKNGYIHVFFDSLIHVELGHMAPLDVSIDMQDDRVVVMKSIPCDIRYI